MTASSSSGSWTTSLTSTVNGLAKSVPAWPCRPPSDTDSASAARAVAALEAAAAGAGVPPNPGA